MTFQSQYPGFISQVWSQKINAGLDKNCVMLQCVNRDWQSEADKGVEAINIVTPGKVSTGVYSGAISGYQSVSGGPSKLKLDRNVYFGFQVPDIDEAQANVSIIDNLTTSAKKSIEEAIDAHLFSLYSGASSENLLGEADAPLTLNKNSVYFYFVALAKKLKLTGAISGATRGWVVVHPDVEELLLLSEQFCAPSQTGDEAIKNGSVGRIAGLDVFVSNNVGKADENYIVMAGTNAAITYASQLSKVETIRAQESFDSIVRGLYTFGALVVNPDAMAVLTCELA